MTPIKTIHAGIINTHIDLTYRSSYSYGAYGGSSFEPVGECCITFETDEHEKLDLCVADEDYAIFEVGDSGKLTFRKDSFISFEKDEEQTEQNLNDL